MTQNACAKAPIRSSHRRVGVLTLSLTPSLLVGCALNANGVGTFKHFESETAYAVNMSVRGAHLVTVPGHTGLTLGSADLWYFFIKDDESVHLERGNWTEQTELWLEGALFTPVSEANQKAISDLGAPIGTSSRRRGLTLSLNEGAAGITIGYTASNELRVPFDFDGVIVAEWPASDPSTGRIFIQETSP